MPDEGPGLIFAYDMAGLPLHEEESAIDQLSKIGYRSLFLRPRRTTLTVDRGDWMQWSRSLCRLAERQQMSLALFVDGPYVFDPVRPGWPSLCSGSTDEADQAAQLDRRYIQAAGALGAREVVLRSGPLPTTPSVESPRDIDLDSDQGELDRLKSRLDLLMNTATECGVRLSLQPCPGDFISSTVHFDRLLQWLGADNNLGLSADIDSMIAATEFPMRDRLDRHSGRLGSIRLDVSHLAGGKSDQAFHFDAQRFLESLDRNLFAGVVILSDQRSVDRGMETAVNAFQTLQSWGLVAAP